MGLPVMRLLASTDRRKGRLDIGRHARRAARTLIARGGLEDLRCGRGSHFLIYRSH
jgi:hypothetical protein